MISQDEIVSICHKSPTIMKMFMRINDKEDLDLQQVKWMYEAWSKHKDQFGKHFVNYNNIEKLSQLSFLIQSFCGVSYDIRQGKVSLIKKLKEESLIYKELNNDIMVEIPDWKTTTLLGSPEWCIVNSHKDYNSYSANKKQYIVFKYDNNDILNRYYGFMSKDGKFKGGYDQNNRPIKLLTDEIVRDFITFKDNKLKTYGSVDDIWKSPIRRENKIKYNINSINYRFWSIYVYSMALNLFLLDNYFLLSFSMTLIIVSMLLFEKKFETSMFLINHQEKVFSVLSLSNSNEIKEGGKLLLDHWNSKPHLKYEYSLYSFLMFVSGSTCPLMSLWIN